MVKLRLRLSQAIEGYLLEAHSRQLSKHTIADYKNGFNKLVDYVCDDPYIDEISPDTLRHLLNYLGSTPQNPDTSIPRAAKPLSRKSLLNIHTALSALWTWAVREGYADVHVPRQVRPPKPEKRVIVPLSQDDIQAILDAAKQTAPYTHRRSGQRSTNARPTTLRDIAIVFLLLDTGIRASELCNLVIADLDKNNNRLRVMGKGAKERILVIGRRTTRSIWRYIITRPDYTLGDPLFASDDDDAFPMNRNSLYQLLARFGKRAGVNNCHPHRFRHTFAIEFLRNGGDIYSLQAMLGHSSLDMVKTYLEIVQSDIENAHQRASPVDNWKL